ncbi:MAG: sigma 54-interacting transcriptional regulator [Ignavibacteria bacterium]|nr:sigma 54-interacting transcriptional regulator [Ignavibacteria bacterium]
MRQLHILIYLAFCVSVFFISNNTSAQNNNFIFEHLNVADGLPNNHVKCIIQDHLGFIWFTTQNGLVKYDGYDFKVYAPELNNPNSLSTRDPITVIEDHLGDLWIGTWSDGLVKFDRNTETFKNYLPDENDSKSLITDGVYVLQEDKEGTLWLGTIGEGMEKFNRETETFTHYRHDPENDESLSNNAVNAIAEDSEGNLWVGTTVGLNKFNKETEKFIRFINEAGNPNSLINSQVHEIIEDHTGKLWIATAGGLSVYNPKQDTWKSYVNEPDNPGSLTNNYLSFIFEDSNNRIWVGSRWNGLNLFDSISDSFIRYNSNPNDPNTISSDYTFSMNEDETGVLWIGCWLSGLNKLDTYSNKFAHYKNIPGDPNSLSNNWIWCLYMDTKGILWIGTRNGGLNRFDPRTESFKNFTNNPDDLTSISDNSIGYIFEDSQSNLWVGTNNALNRFNRSTETFLHFYPEREDERNIVNGTIMAIAEDLDNNLWLGTYGGGLIKLDLNSDYQNELTFTRYLNDPADPNSLNLNRINTLYIDSFGTLWVGTDVGGLDKYLPESESFEHFYERESGLDVIVSIYEDRAGRFWIGTYNEGLNLFNRNTGTREIFSTIHGLPDHAIKDILEDSNGNLWLSTERGLSKFNYENKSIRNYTVSEGLQAGFFHMRAAAMGTDGEMYFGGINGFNRFNPNKLIDNPFPPEIIISDIKLSDTSLLIRGDSPLKKHINVAEEIELAYDQNDITIEYVGLHYSRSEEITYEYKLKNYDRNWRKAGKNRHATYTNLEPGEYKFFAKAKSSDGVVCKTPASINIIIVPPFWQTVWFRVLIAFILISLLYLGYRLRVSQLEKKRKQLEERVAERTEAAQKLQSALAEVEVLKNRLHDENIYLQSEIKVEHNFENIISTSDKFNKVLGSVEQVASTDSTVLILGETGTGKELLARAIHSIGKRSNRPLVKVNCATLPENLIESELFGHEKGAFTGATSRKIGRFELAAAGTIFLDEIGELPLGLQTKLLRVLQEGEFERLGDPKTIQVDVRVIAATNRELEKEIKAGNFREDLFYRLNVFPIEIPPLRERKEDIPLLVKHFLKKYNAKAGKTVEIISKDTMEKLLSYPWPGNVRELENIIERAVITSTGNKIILGDWLSQADLLQSKLKILPLEEMEKNYIIEVLETTQWKVSGEKGAAKVLDINPQTLVSRMKKLGIQKPK